jgi:hypothetical protein
VNELEADPRIAPRVQLWLFACNTGLPILYSSGLLRQTLTRTVTELDPRGTDPAMRRMVLIGHSQGGLLAKLAVVDSGTKFWDNYWRTIEPSRDRDWAPEVARLPHATVDGDLVTLHDVRSFDAYRPGAPSCPRAAIASNQCP